eukprot:CAMPEP_0174817920 /NCGR_PEP_ID=MMETSP1107-20130205/476_1 /TAXON_ID=36770 /ORGANISM="Paraphysomonas vestita, Strain GFlagA" /LENGTH=716 /DNA_ID=CAMNT_0016029061 /DNA_START=188 /DNA_END=2338 /DNA_ORIENTATION=-
MWLDQDVPDDQPRKIFFHGPTNSIEHAVQRVSELVQSAPILSNTKIAAGFNLTSIIFDCPPPLVGMVIGKKGWTIKKIQEVSGAQISINQSVREGLPRKVIVSGDVDAVYSALDLIGDLVRDKAATLKIELPAVLTSGRTNLQPLRTNQPSITRQYSSPLPYHSSHTAGIHQDTYLVFADHEPNIGHHTINPPFQQQSQSQQPSIQLQPQPQQQQQQPSQLQQHHHHQQHHFQSQQQQQQLPPPPLSSPLSSLSFQQQQQQLYQQQQQQQQQQSLQGPQFEVTRSPINAAEHPSFFASNNDFLPQQQQQQQQTAATTTINRGFLGQRSSTFDNIIVPYSSTATTTTSSSSSIRPQEAVRNNTIIPRSTGISNTDSREIRTSVSDAHLPLSSPQNQQTQNQNQQLLQQQNQQQQQQQIFQRNNSSHFFPEGFNPSKNSGSNYAQHVQHFQQHQQQQNQSQQQQQQQHHHHQQQQQQTQPQHHHQHQQQQQQYLYLDSQSLSRVFQPEKPDIIPSSRQPFASTSIGSIGQMYEPDEEKPLHPQQQQLQLQQQHQHQQQSQQSQSTIWTSTSTPATLPSVSISTHYETVHEEPRVSKRRPSGGSQRHLFTSLVLPEPSPRSIGRGFSFASSRSDFPSFETTTDTSSVSLGTPDGRSFRNRQSFFPMTRSSEGFTSGEYSDTEYKLQRTTSPPILLDPPSSSLSSSRQTNTINRNMEGNR